MNFFSKPKTAEQKLTLLQKINPTNLQSEKEKFYFDQSYNPQFTYAEDITPEELLTYGEVSVHYLEQARWVIDTVIKKFGSESNFLKEVEGPVLSQEAVLKQIESYLVENGISERVQIVQSSQYLARTSVKRQENKFSLQMRTPFEYREAALEGTLNHELGTHVFRWINELKQPWHQQRARFNLHPHLRTEEGIASLNTNINREKPYIWLYALYYYAVVQANHLSFAELYKDLRRYIDDRDRCWKICMRVKRGVRDTSLPLTFSKDQTYLQGMMELKTWLVKHDYDIQKLYMGKIDFADWGKLKHFYRPEELQIPLFMQDSKEYIRKIKHVYSFNHLMT